MGELHKRAINPVRALMLHLPEVRAGRRLFKRFRAHMRALLQQVHPATPHAQALRVHCAISHVVAEACVCASTTLCSAVPACLSGPGVFKSVCPDAYWFTCAYHSNAPHLPQG